jgi:hypothetical protein
MSSAQIVASPTVQPRANARDELKFESQNDASGATMNALEKLGHCPDVVTLKSDLQRLCETFGRVARLNVLTAMHEGRKQATCFLRLAFNASGVSGRIVLGTSNNIALKTVIPVSVPLTGINFGTNMESYGGQTISTISLGANGAATIPAPAW